MIITRTPLRISLVGGGTDLPAFYQQDFGAVVSFGINKYIYVVMNEKFDGKTRVSYSKTENVGHPMELKHDIIRESLIQYRVQGMDIAVLADIPGSGTGLGSSSALAVGLVKALNQYKGESNNMHPGTYAEQAFDIERNHCLHSVGKQDHYAAAHGDLHYFQFNPGGGVISELLFLNESEMQEFESHFVLLWTDRSRSAKDILQTQEKNMDTERRSLAVDMRDLAVRLRDDLKRKDFSNIGTYLHANWLIKRQLANGITSDWIDQKYQAAMDAGAQGGKLCGAGGGGFLLFYGPLGIGPALEKATGLKQVHFKIDELGSQVIYA